MNPPALLNKLAEIQAGLSRLDNDICAVMQTDLRLYPENFSRAAVEAALRSEKVTCGLRTIAGLVPTEKPYLTGATEVLDISIQMDGDVLKCILPCLLPQRKAHTSADFLMMPVYYALQKYAMAHTLPHYERYTLCLRHVYDAALGCGYVRDYDNMEIKPVLDAVALYFMPDDSGLCCDLYHTTGTGPYSCTELYLMDSEWFPMWLSKRKSV